MRDLNGVLQPCQRRFLQHPRAGKKRFASRCGGQLTRYSNRQNNHYRQPAVTLENLHHFSCSGKMICGRHPPERSLPRQCSTSAKHLECDRIPSPGGKYQCCLNFFTVPGVPIFIGKVVSALSRRGPSYLCNIFQIKTGTPTVPGITGRTPVL